MRRDDIVEVLLTPLVWCACIAVTACLLVLIVLDSIFAPVGEDGD